MRRSLGLQASALCGLITALSLVLAVAAEDCADFLSGCSYTTETGVGWFYSDRERAFFRVPASFEPPRDAPRLEWSHVPACDENRPGSTSVLCTAAMCLTNDDQPGIRFIVYSRRTDQPAADWQVVGETCVAGDNRVDVAEVEREVERVIEDRFSEITTPALHVAPDGGALVNLPVLVWTDPSEDLSFAIDQPLPGRVSASPEYDWTFSDGTTGSGVGRPFEAALAPSHVPDYYLHTTYRRPGPADVTLNATWSGTVTVQDLAPVPIEPLVYRATEQFPVREARTVLVDGGP